MSKGIGFAIALLDLFLASAVGRCPGDGKSLEQPTGFPVGVHAQTDFGRMPLYFIANKG